MLNCVIVDDEPLAREILTGYIVASPGANLLASFSTAGEALRYLQEKPGVDVLFLDIEMPEMSGLDLLKQLTDAPITVFTTAFRDYAFEGFELGVIDFLLKPISKRRFEQALEKIADFFSLKTEEARLEQEHGVPDFIFVKSGVERIRLVLQEVTHIQGLKDYAIIHTSTGKIVLKGSVKAMQELFPAPAFLRVHKSFIVASGRVERIAQNRIFIGPHQVPVGRAYKEQLTKLYPAASLSKPGSVP